MIDNTEKCYSLNGEDYRSDIEDIFDDIKCEHEVGDEVSYFEAETKKQTHQDFLIIDRLIEDMQEQAYGVAPEYADDYLDDLSNEKKMELQELVLKWLNDNAKQPTFFMCENPEEIKGWWNGEEIQSTPMLSESEARNLID